MKRRNFLYSVGTAAASTLMPSSLVQAAGLKNKTKYGRVRPGDRNWPTAKAWNELRRIVGKRLIKVDTPLTICAAKPDSSACAAVFDLLKNPYAIGDEAGLTQALGWADAWICEPSAYAVACQDTKDVVAAVHFARAHKLRLVIKGGGHSYQGTSNAADSLLIWTRKMNTIVVHDAFVAQGCAATQSAVPAVTVDAGALWMQTYHAVTTKARRYVQGGGCATVGVAGLIQSGGFGSYSKYYGMAAASLLEAEIVTADGVPRTVNACTHPDLFWAIKGGGGGSFGVVTKVTLQTHDLPNYFGVVRLNITATSDQAFRRLIARVIAFYADHLCNPQWGEKIIFKTENKLAIDMEFLGLDKKQATELWQPFFDWLAQASSDYLQNPPAMVLTLPAHLRWDAQFLRTIPGVLIADNRPDAPAGNVFWSGNQEEAGKFLHGYQSAWVPASLLQADQQQALVEALFLATRTAEIAFHCNKGLAGAPAQALSAAQDTAMNPAVLDAFALAICADEEAIAHPWLPGHKPDLVAARKDAFAIDQAMNALRSVIPDAGSYVSESNFFEKNWQQSFWGRNYPRLLAVKQKYDPEGLFFVHHGVGTEEWSADGFTRKM